MPSQLSRRSLLRLAASAVPLLSRNLFAAQDGDEAVRRERIADVFRSYHFQGSHRTGSVVDNESGEWLASEAARLGAEVSPRQFPLQKVDLHACYVEAGTVKREGLPFFDGGFTSASGISGRCGSRESGAPIVLVTLNGAAIASEGRALAALRKAPDVQAIVAITEGGKPGLCPSNAGSFHDPYGVPVVQVSSTAREWLEGVSQSGAPLHVVAAATRSTATAANVIATVRGRRPDLAPVVVMTPRSGWWQCASERGGGLACWLEIMRGVADVRPERTVRFVASSGHELGHAGLDAFLREEPDLIKSAAAWLHLGANIGAAEGRTRLQSSDDAIEALAIEAMQKVEARVDQRVPRGTVPAGEARNIHTGGGRYVSLLGSGPWFHNPFDLWPYAVDLDATMRYAAATTELTLRLARA
jgi:hypothetical protein